MPIKEIYKKAKRAVDSLLSDGTEKLDPTPVEVPLALQRPETIQEQIRRMIKTEASFYAEENGAETFEEANDFTVGDDFDPASPYELLDDEGLSTPEPSAPTSPDTPAPSPDVPVETSETPSPEVTT